MKPMYLLEVIAPTIPVIPYDESAAEFQGIPHLYIENWCAGPETK